MADDRNRAAAIALISSSGSWTQSLAAAPTIQSESTTETALTDSLSSPCYSPSPEFEFKDEPLSVETLNLCMNEIKAELAPPPSPEIESIKGLAGYAYEKCPQTD